MGEHEGMDQKLKQLAKAGLGVVSSAIEKTGEAISSLVKEENIDKMAAKGEEAFQQVKAFGASTVDKVKRAWDESAAAAKDEEKTAKLQRLARAVHDLPQEDREVFAELLRKLDEGYPPEDGSIQSDEDFSFGKTEPSDSVEELAREADSTAPVKPDDEENINKIKANDVNDHIPQSVPREY